MRKCEDQAASSRLPLPSLGSVQRGEPPQRAVL